MLEVFHLTKVYKTKGGADVKALDDVSLRFPETGMVFLLGRSGSGKSTLLNVCGGPDSPTYGEIVVKGKSSKSFSPSDFDSYRNTFIGFVFQEYNILDEFSVEDNIALALELQGKPKDKKEIAALLERVDLAGYAKRRPNTLSVGQKQRLAIARALVKKPEIIMADEPTGALDSETGKQIFDTLKKLSGEKLVIVASRDREFAEQYGDRIIELKDGKIVSDVTKTQEVGSAMSATLPARKYPPGKSRFIRPGLSVRHAVRIGTSGLKSKPLRLFFTVLLSTVAFVMFGLLSAMMTYNEQAVLKKSLINSDYSSLNLGKQYDHTYTTFHYEDKTESSYTVTRDTFFTKAETEDLKEKFGNDTFAALPAVSSVSNLYGEASDYYSSLVSFIAYLPASHPFRSKITGSYPAEGKKEICISSFLSESLFRRGMYDPDTGREYTLSAPTNVIGKKIVLRDQNYTVSGIFDCGAPSPRYDKVRTGDATEALVSEWQKEKQSGLYQLTFVDEETETSWIEYGYFGYEREEFRNAFGNYAFNVRSQESGYSSPCLYAPDSKMPLRPYFFSENKTELSDNEILVSDLMFAEMLDCETDAVSNAISARAYARMNEECGALYARLDEIAESLQDDLTDEEKTQLSDETDEILAQIEEKKAIIFAVHNEIQADCATSADENGNDYRIGIIDKVRLFAYDYNHYTGKALTREEKKSYLEDIRGFIKKYDVPLEFTVNISNPIGEFIERSVTVAGIFHGEQNALFMTDENFETFRTFSDKYRESVLGRRVEYPKNYVKSADAVYAAVFIPYDRSAGTTDEILNLVGKRADDGSFVAISNTLYDTLFEITNLVETVSDALLVYSLIFAVFAALLLCNFISVSIAYKKKEIGILRAMGAKRLDIFKIFFSEALVVTAICVALSAIGGSVLCAVLNNCLSAVFPGVPAFVFGPLSVLVPIGIALPTAAVAAYLPVRIAAKGNPAESIRAL